MISRRFTLFWLAVAVLLGAFIFFIQPRLRHKPAGPVKVFAELRPHEVTAVRVHPRGQPEIRAVRTNDSWQLVEPLLYPAEGPRIESLLTALEKLIAPSRITPQELKSLPKGEEEFGFDTPEIVVQIEQHDAHSQLQVGSKTAPGDQVFCRLNGADEVLVVGSELLKLLPRTPNAWRQASFINFKSLSFDSVAVTNGANMSVLRRDIATNRWRMIFPIAARADNSRIEEALGALQKLQIHEFLPEDTKADSELLGLQPAELELVLRDGSNVVAWMQFGKSPTNAPKLVYARLIPQNTLGSVARSPLGLWYGPAYSFRDPHLVNLSQPVTEIEVHGEDTFSLQRLTNDTWRVMPLDFPADGQSVTNLISLLGGMQVAQFVKAVVIEPDLPGYGLASPARQYVLKFTTNCAAGPTNLIVADLRFGTNADDKVYVRRGDEDSVYAVNLADFQALPAASWQMRARQLWNFTEEDVSGAKIFEQGKTRELINKGNHQWTLAAGSQGSIETFAVDQTIRGLGRLNVLAWAGRGSGAKATYGFIEGGHRITVELKNGERKEIEFGGQSPSGVQYAGVNLDNDFWVFALEPKLSRDVALYLSIQ